jgi:multiple sugar transport system substrate-binding protein
MNTRIVQKTILLLTIVSLLLVACQSTTPAPLAPEAPAIEQPVVGPTATEPSVAVQPTTEPPPAPVPTDPPAPVEEVVEIVYMRQADNPDIELDYVKEFEDANPNIRVRVDSVPANDTYNKLVLTSNAGNPPDVFMSFWTADAVSNGLIYPLDEFVDQDDFNNRFTSAGSSYAKYQDTIYAIPWRAGASVFLVNCQMFEDANLTVPTLGWTWDDLVTLSEQLTDIPSGKYGFGLVGSSTDFATEWQFWPFLLQAGGDIVVNNRAAFNSPEGVQALEYLISLKPFIPEGFTSMDLNQLMDLFVSNRVAMFQDGPWFIGIIQKGHPDFDICVAPMVEGDEPGNITGGTALGISPLSQNKEAAWKFIEFMTSDDVLTRWNEATDNVPPVKSAFERPTYAEGPMSVAAEVVDQPGVIPANQYPESTRLNTIIRNYLQAAYLGQMTPQEALDQAALEWDDVLQNYD